MGTFSAQDLDHHDGRDEEGSREQNGGLKKYDTSGKRAPWIDLQAQEK